MSTTVSATEEEKESKEKQNSKSEISEILDSMGYPELQVVPRASERLAIEAKNEDSNWVLTHWPIELSGLFTLAVGFTAKGNQREDLTTQEKSDANTIAAAASTVGIAWIVGGALLGAQRPYKNGVQAIAKYPGKDERSTLMRERLAEEALERPARVMSVLESVAIVTNLGANIAAGIHANASGRMMAGIGAVISLLPIFFEDHNIDVYNKHQEYKRKIYTPIKSASFSYDPEHKTLTPMTSLLWSF